MIRSIRKADGRTNNPRMGVANLRRHPKNDIATMPEHDEAWNARQELLKAAERHMRVKAAGFAGCLPGGMLVDRRDHPEALPIPANTVLLVPPPTLCGNCGSRKLAWRTDCPHRTETICLDCQATAPTTNPDAE
jgi:hypothetical protein